MTSPVIHFAIAEKGKLHALAGEHVAAMTHYRDAMALAVEHGAPEVMFRHYMECALESLERMGEYDDVIEYCDRAIAHYRANPPAHEIARLDLASVHQRRGVVLFKRGDSDAARAALRDALACITGVSGATQALAPAQNLLRWLDSRMHVSAARLEDELERGRYYCVRRDTVSEARARRVDHRPAAMSIFAPEAK